MKVLVVDNADDTVGLDPDTYPFLEAVSPGANIGFARATNLGIRRGRAPYVLALNPDTEVTPGALDLLLDLMERRPEIGICGCRLVRPDGSLDHAAKRAFPTPLSALGHFTGLGRLPRAPRRLSAYRAPDVAEGRVDAVNGAFMLMRRRALQEVGLFDERFWMYMEDLDLCYRMAQAGWLTWYEPRATVLHHKGGSAGTHRTLRLDLAFHAGMARFYRKHYACRRSRVVNAVVYAGVAAKLTSSVIRSAFARYVLQRAGRGFAAPSGS